jgi:hypothetical protein
MNRLGIQSLNAGAPDLRLTGDQTQRGGTYTQRRRNQMAYGGIAGLDGRKRYGIGSWIQEKIKDPIKEKFVDPAIDFVTENPMLVAGGLGALANYKDLIPGQMSSEGWIGDLLGGAGNVLGTGARKVGTTLGIPGADQWFTGGISPYSGVTGLLPPGMGMGSDLSPTEYAKRYLTDYVGSQLGLTPQDQERQKQLNQRRELQRINWEVPMAIGAGAGAYQKKYLEDQPKFGEDTTGIKFQTAKEVMADPEQRFKPQEQYVLPSALAAEGGRIGYERGRVVRPGGYAGVVDKNIANLQTRKELYPKEWTEEDEAELQRQIELKGGVRDKLLSGDPVPETEDEGSFWDFLPGVGNAQGGRIGYQEGLTVAEKTPLYIDPETDLPLHNIEKEIQGMDREQRLKKYFEMLRRIESYKDIEELPQGTKFEDLLHWGALGGDEISGGGSGAPGMTEALEFTEHPAAEALYERGEHFNRGGRIGAQEGGLMNLGGMEKDYRQEGGFVPLGGEEKADDVPARLSKNEFVFTADAVRAAGGGDIDAGAEVMENVMENLEAGGEISEDSQGLEGARGMFANAQQLEKRII